MFVAVLIAPPGSGALTAARVAPLQARWGGGPLRWLAPGEAGEFTLPKWPGDAVETAHEWRAGGVDLALVSTENRRKQVLIADMDSTMIGQECIDELADVAGVGAEVADITAKAMNGDLDFEGALAARVRLLAGLPESAVAEVWAQRIRYASGARTLVSTMAELGAHCLLVSGGFTVFTERVAAGLGFHAHRANRLEVAGGRLTGRVLPPVLGKAAKVTALEETLAALGLGPADAIAVGDGANDLGMLERAGLGVALHAKPAVAAAAPVRIDHGDLTALLYLQGITPTADRL